MEFQLEYGTVFPSPDWATVQHCLQQLSPDTANTFAILDVYGAVSGPRYIQVACDGSKFIIEKREGEPPHHYRAVRKNVSWNPFSSKSAARLFSHQEAIEAVCAFGFNGPALPQGLEWVNMDAEVGLG